MRHGRGMLTFVQCLLVAAALLGCSGGHRKASFSYFPHCDLQGVTVSAPTTSSKVTANVYHLDPLRADAAYAAAIASRLGLSSAPVQQPDFNSQPSFVVDDAAGHLEVTERTGKLVFEPTVVEQDNNAAKIGPEDAAQRVTQWLEHAGLLPVVHLTPDVELVDQSADVTQRWNDLPMLEKDDGQFVEAELTPGGELYRLTYFWREPHVVDRYRLISSDEARARMERGECRSGGVVASSDPVVDNDLSQVELLYVPSPNLGGDFMIPAYVFHSDTKIGGWWSKWAAVPALPDEYITKATPQPHGPLIY